ncbi:MAG: hypothetical protein H0V80_03980 [Acidobacteria bacterium]|nr:hypothetical protein [Acidobacteriota bacterium]
MFAYRGTQQSLAEIGRELGADYLVEGSMRSEGGRLRVTSRLIRAADQVQLWSDSIDRERGSTLGVQQELSRHIAPPAGDCCPRRWSRVRDRLS